MKSLKRFKENGRSKREYRAFMVDLLNLMSMAYAIELNESHGFGANRLSSVTDGAIKRIHAAVGKYEKEFADMALIDWCRRIGFDWRIGLDEKYAIKFIGGEGEEEMRCYGIREACPHFVRAERKKGAMVAGITYCTAGGVPRKVDLTALKTGRSPMWCPRRKGGDYVKDNGDSESEGSCEV